jgi:hypothetical protein
MHWISKNPQYTRQIWSDQIRTLSATPAFGKGTLRTDQKYAARTHAPHPCQQFNLKRLTRDYRDLQYAYTISFSLQFTENAPGSTSLQLDCSKAVQNFRL